MFREAISVSQSQEENEGNFMKVENRFVCIVLLSKKRYYYACIPAETVYVLLCQNKKNNLNEYFVGTGSNYFTRVHFCMSCQSSGSKRSKN